MARRRKRHVQQGFSFRKLDKNGQARGGSHKNAGRKPVLDEAGRRRMSHQTRPSINKAHPQHVTLRVSPEVGWLRKLDAYNAIRGALRTVLVHAEYFRIVHFSLQNTHLHLLVEADDKAALTKGMRAFMISAAKRINAAISRRRRLVTRRRGVVFTDRYHVEPLSSPRQVRNALAYVLNNWRRHRIERETSIELCGGQLDPYSSALAFTGWREPLAPPGRLPPGYGPPETSPPRVWYLKAGWMRARAPSISCFEIPGPRSRDAVRIAHD